MKTWHLIIAACLSLLTACKHEQISSVAAFPDSDERKTSDAAVVHEKLPGTWTCNQRNENCRFYAMKLESDGDLLVSDHGESLHWVGTWKLQEPFETVTNGSAQSTKMRQLHDHGSILYLTYGKPSPNNFDVEILPVKYIDDHELVLYPGISVAGWPYRFKRQE